LKTILTPSRAADHAPWGGLGIWRTHPSGWLQTTLRGVFRRGDNRDPVRIDMKHILLVDDDIAGCEATTEILVELEWAVEIVNDGGTALERLRQSVPDAVLVGLNIPDMVGGAFVVACHQEPCCRDVPVVVMAVTPRAAVDAIRLGARGCIKKPVDMGSVVAALQPLLHDTPVEHRN
jgi:two-component system response regulator RegX3